MLTEVCIGSPVAGNSPGQPTVAVENVTAPGLGLTISQRSMLRYQRVAALRSLVLPLRFRRLPPGRGRPLITTSFGMYLRTRLK
jgi:hypothetical protein